MSASLIAALCCTVLLLVTTAYFLLGSIPLLVLQHDTPLDARFVRGFFNTYYLAAMVVAGAAAASYAWAGTLGFALGAAALALLAAAMRRAIIPMMDRLRTQIPTAGAQAIRQFRRAHLSAIAVNLIQLALIVWCLVAFPL